MTNKQCEYCDGSGEIETDNNGPIGPCPICCGATDKQEMPDVIYAGKLDVSHPLGVLQHSWSEEPGRRLTAEYLSRAHVTKLIEQARREERELLKKFLYSQRIEERSVIRNGNLQDQSEARTRLKFVDELVKVFK